MEISGAPGKIRTPDPQIRSLVLYPAELPVLWVADTRQVQGPARALLLNLCKVEGKLLF